MKFVAKLLGATALAAGLSAGVAAPADAGVSGCTFGYVAGSNIGVDVGIVPLYVAPRLGSTDPTIYSNCLLDSTGFCIVEFDPYGVHSQGLVPETTGFANCLVF